MKACCRHPERSRGIPWRNLEGNATGFFDRENIRGSE